MRSEAETDRFAAVLPTTCSKVSAEHARFVNEQEREAHEPIEHVLFFARVSDGIGFNRNNRAH